VAVTAQIAQVLPPVATITTSVAKVLPQVTLVLTEVAQVLATFFPGVVVPDLASVPSQLAAILTNLMVVAAKLARVAADFAPVRAQLVCLARRHSRVGAGMRMIYALRVHERGTSSQQGRGNSGDSEIAHCISQRQDRALAALACAARTTVAPWRTLRAGSSGPFERGKFFRSQVAKCHPGAAHCHPSPDGSGRHQARGVRTCAR